jgi:aspartyl-tRNA(Asn)/glutamyl-tRNA(Gln) amidotransferase subunit A
VSNDELCLMPIAELSGLIARREVSPVEVVQATLERIQRLEPTLHAFITVTADLATQAAREAEREIASGSYRGPLHGIPVSLKDIVYLEGVLNTSGSRTMADFVPGYDATVTRKLKAAGAVFAGKTQLYEFAMGPKTFYEDEYTRNPWNTGHIPGGSSSGSAAAVAAGLSHVSIGTDTGGSVRGPASICGVVGLKPTYGRVSRYGIVPQSWSMDHAGPLTRTVSDCALAMNAISGYDPADPGSLDAPVPDFAGFLDGEVSGMRIGVCREFYPDGAHPEFESAFREALRVLQSAGADVAEFSFPMARHAPPLYSAVVLPENASIQEERIRTQADLFTPDARNKTEQGAFVLATDYLKAQRVRTVFRREYEEATRGLDVVVMLTFSGPPPAYENIPPRSDRERAALVEKDLGRRTYNLLGAPAISVPCGFTSAGLPVGLHIAARPMEDALVLKVAHAYEQRADWHQMHPPLP